MSIDEGQQTLVNVRPPVTEYFRGFTRSEINAALFPSDVEREGKTLVVGLKSTGWAFFREVSEGDYSHVRPCDRKQNDQLTAIFRAVRLKCIDHQNGGATIPIVIAWEPRE